MQICDICKNKADYTVDGVIRIRISSDDKRLPELILCPMCLHLLPLRRWEDPLAGLQTQIVTMLRKALNMQD
jgi:hypothetical protein